MDYTECYVNIPQQERNYPAYRIISRERLYELFDKQKNTLIKLHKWEDPFENFILRLKGQLPNGEVVEFGQRHDFYGQCWTLRGNTDAMWRIYSTDKKSLRIKVRIRKLIETLAPTVIGPVFVGKVRYLTTEGLLRWAKNVLRNAKSPDINLLARTVLVKRTAFSHEQEVRLLYFDPREEQPITFQYPVDPHTFIEEIVIDPRLSLAEIDRFIEEIRVKTGFRGKIAQSDLYAPPRELVIKLGPAYSSLTRSSENVGHNGDMREITIQPGLNSQIILPPASPRRIRS